MAAQGLMQRRLRWAGILVLLGVLTEGVALRWSHPTAFLVLAFIGMPLVMLGVVIFLWSLVSEGGAGG
jgi:hypothetical protein